MPQSFPLDLSSALPAPTAAGGSATPPAPCRILVVEDHPDSARMLQRLLTHFGHAPTLAATVGEALAALRCLPFDLLISDIGLPDGTGYDLLQQAPTPRPPALACSGFSTQEDHARSLAAGFLEHLTKPLDIPHLQTAILRAVQSIR